MKGLEKNAWEEDKHTNRQTLQILDQLYPEGRVGENPLLSDLRELNFTEQFIAAPVKYELPIVIQTLQIKH